MGSGATLDANHRWPDLLANRLDAKQPNTWGVVNMGISGNRVLGDGAGQSALARFDRDVLSTPGVKVVIIFEGVNDLGIAFGNVQGPMAELFKARAPSAPVTAESMIAGYRQLIARAHGKGVKVLGATITPYRGAFYYTAEGEAWGERHQGVGRDDHALWRRAVLFTRRRGDTPGDQHLDPHQSRGRRGDRLRCVMRDPSQPTQIKDGFHFGDHLHGSDAGYAAMAAAINLALFN